VKLKKPETNNQDQNNDKTMSIIAYLGFIGIIVVVATGAHQKSKDVKFHLNQSITLLMCSLVSVIPFIGWIAAIGVFTLWVICFIGAINGEKKVAPIVGNFNLVK
jgi:uncharacterized membrane protein